MPRYRGTAPGCPWIALRPGAQAFHTWFPGKRPGSWVPDMEPRAHCLDILASGRSAGTPGRLRSCAEPCGLGHGVFLPGRTGIGGRQDCSVPLVPEAPRHRGAAKDAWHKNEGARKPCRSASGRLGIDAHKTPGSRSARVSGTGAPARGAGASRHDAALCFGTLCVPAESPGRRNTALDTQGGCQDARSSGRSGA